MAAFAKLAPARRSTSSTTARRTPTATSTSATRSTRFSRTSSSSRRPWRASTRPTFPAGIATACRSRSRSIANSGRRSPACRPLEIRRACRKYAEKYVKLQREDFKRLGVFGDWDHPYLTMSPEYQATIAGAFVDFLDQGYVYKGLKPVNWCIRDRTALAEAEVEYENHTSPSIWVRFALTSDPGEDRPCARRARRSGASSGRRLPGPSRPTWRSRSTRPSSTWPCSPRARTTSTSSPTGCCRRPRRTSGGATTRSSPSSRAGCSRGRSSGIRSSSATRLGILGEHVTLEQGTGAVHTAPGHGQEDFVIGRQYGINTYCPVDAAGRFYRRRRRRRRSCRTNCSARRSGRPTPSSSRS